MRLKNNYFFSTTIVIFLVLGTIFIISCASGKNSGQIQSGKTASVEDMKTVTDFSGIYKLSDKLICDLVITISKKGDEYIYTIKGTGFKSSGKLSIGYDDGQTYLNFNGTLRSGDKTPVTGLYQDKKIVIQNYGNSMNRYVCFKSCDSKYLEFVKSE